MPAPRRRQGRIAGRSARDQRTGLGIGRAERRELVGPVGRQDHQIGLQMAARHARGNRRCGGRREFRRAGALAGLIADRVAGAFIFVLRNRSWALHRAVRRHDTPDREPLARSCAGNAHPSGARGPEDHERSGFSFPSRRSGPCRRARPRRRGPGRRTLQAASAAGPSRGAPSGSGASGWRAPDSRRRRPAARRR